MSDWKTPVTREEYAKLTQVSRVAALRGKYKAKKRALSVHKRTIMYENRAESDYQRSLGMYYRTHFTVE